MRKVYEARTIILLSPGCPQYNNYCRGVSGVSACAQLSVQYALCAHVCAHDFAMVWYDIVVPMQI